MNITDIILILIIAAALVLAVRSTIKQRRTGGCSCGCSGCNMQCSKKQKQ